MSLRTFASNSVASIGFSLFTIGLFGLVAQNFRNALETLAERVEVVAFVLRGTPTETISTASQDIAAFPEVLEVKFVSADQALARARVELVEFTEADVLWQLTRFKRSFEHTGSASRASNERMDQACAILANELESVRL